MIKKNVLDPYKTEFTDSPVIAVGNEAPHLKGSFPAEMACDLKGGMPSCETVTLPQIWDLEANHPFEFEITCIDSAKEDCSRQFYIFRGNQDLSGSPAVNEAF